MCVFMFLHTRTHNVCSLFRASALLMMMHTQRLELSAAASQNSSNHVHLALFSEVPAVGAVKDSTLSECRATLWLMALPVFGQSKGLGRVRASLRFSGI